MTAIQRWITFTAVGVVAVLVAGWFLLVNPQRSRANELRQQTQGVQAKSAALRTELVQLEQQAAELPTKQAQLAKFSRQIPDTPALPSLIRSLTRIADGSGVTLVSIAPQPPVAYQSSNSGGTGGSSGSASSGTTSKSAATGSSAGGSSGGSGGLSAVNLELKVDGTYANLEEFILSLESLERVFLVDGYGLQPGGEDAATGSAGSGSTGGTGSCADPCMLEMNLTGHVYLTSAAAPASSGATNSAANPTTSGSTTSLR